MELRGIAVEQDTQYAELLHNRRYIQDKQLVHTALKYGILAPDGYVLDMEGENLIPLLKGILKECLADGQMKVVTGGLRELERQQVAFSDETVYLTETFSRADLNDADLYTAVVNLQEQAVYVWKAQPGLMHPAIYRGTAYWLEDGTLLLKNAQRRHFTYWYGLEGAYTAADASALGLTAAEFTAKYMDKTVYMVIDDYSGLAVKALAVDE